MNKKKLVILIVVILVIIVQATILTLWLTKRAKYVYDIEEVSHIEYNTINIDNRYGIIDGSGNIIIEPNYDVIQIPNPAKPIFFNKFFIKIPFSFSIILP